MTAITTNKIKLKIIILGDVGVGKTSVINQYTSQFFPSPQFVARIPPDFLVKHARVGNRQVTLQFWDPAGLERFGPIHKPWYRNTHCCVLVYDINKVESFASLQKWFDESSEVCSNSNVGRFPFILLGNKIDNGEKRQISPEQALGFCETNGNIPYFETSAKDATNLQEAFEIAARLALGHKDALDKVAEDNQNLLTIGHSNRRKICW